MKFGAVFNSAVLELLFSLKARINFCFALDMLRNAQSERRGPAQHRAVLRRLRTTMIQRNACNVDLYIFSGTASKNTRHERTKVPNFRGYPAHSLQPLTAFSSYCLGEVKDPSYKQVSKLDQNPFRRHFLRSTALLIPIDQLITSCTCIGPADAILFSINLVIVQIVLDFLGDSLQLKEATRAVLLLENVRDSDWRRDTRSLWKFRSANGGAKIISSIHLHRVV